MQQLQPVVHHAAPRAVVYICMVMLAVIALPAYVLEPARALTTGGVVSLLVFFSFETLLWALTRRRVILSTDDARQALFIRSVRWPLADQYRQVPLSDIVGVTKQRAPTSRAVRLALTLRSGEETSLTRSYFGDRSQMDRDADAIRQLCGVRA